MHLLPPIRSNFLSRQTSSLCIRTAPHISRPQIRVLRLLSSLPLNTETGRAGALEKRAIESTAHSFIHEGSGGDLMSLPHWKLAEKRVKWRDAAAATRAGCSLYRLRRMREEGRESPQTERQRKGQGKWSLVGVHGEGIHRGGITSRVECCRTLLAVFPFRGKRRAHIRQQARPLARETVCFPCLRSGQAGRQPHQRHSLCGPCGDRNGCAWSLCVCGGGGQGKPIIAQHLMKGARDRETDRETGHEAGRAASEEPSFPSPSTLRAPVLRRAMQTAVCRCYGVWSH